MVAHRWSHTQTTPLLCYLTWLLVLPIQSQSLLLLETIKLKESHTDWQVPQVSHHFTASTNVFSVIYNIIIIIYFASAEPGTVLNLRSTEVTTSSVSLSWTKPDGNATSYTVQWTTHEGSFSNTTNNTTFTIINLTPGSQYNITVAAVAVLSSNNGTMTLITVFTSRSILWDCCCFKLRQIIKEI